MAIVHKVILLHKPFKVFGFTIVQLCVLLGTSLLGLWIWANLPPVKVNGLPLGFLVFMFILCIGIVFVHASLIQPWQWWRNRILSVAQLLPTEILPKPQPPKTYIEEAPNNKSPDPGFTDRKWQL